MSFSSISPRGRLAGLVLLLVLLVGIVLIIVGIRERAHSASSAPAPTASTSQLEEPVKIPEEARTSIWRSPQKASGELIPATQTLPATLTTEKTNGFSVEVETSLGLDPDEAARTVHKILNDERGWAGYGKNGFSLVNTGSADLRILIAAPDTVDKLCGADVTKGLDNCQTGDTVVINSDRWFYMVPNFNNLDEYRAWAINHQVGKWLGQKVGYCNDDEQLAPVMVDQATKLGECLPNAWPKLVD